MKPEIKNPNQDALVLDVTMLSEEAYKLEKQKKMEEMIQKAGDQKPQTSQEYIPQEEKFDVSEDSGDLINLANFYLEKSGIKPIDSQELGLITNIIQDFSQIDFREVLSTGKLPGSTLKNFARLGKITTLMKEVIIPRVQDIYNRYKDKQLGDSSGLE